MELPLSRGVAIIVAGGLLAACGQSSLASPSRTVTPTPTATPSVTPDVQRNAASALNRAVSEYNDVLNLSSSKLRAAFAQGDISGMQSDAISVFRAIISFDDSLNAIKMPEAARADAQTLITANANLEGMTEAIYYATSRTEIANLYSQIPMAQRMEQTSLNQLATDLGLSASFVIVSITG